MALEIELKQMKSQRNDFAEQVEEYQDELSLLQKKLQEQTVSLEKAQDDKKEL